MRKGRVQEWKERKALHEVDPVQVLKGKINAGDEIMYANHTEKLYSVCVKVANGLVLAKTDRAVLANRTKFYIPVHDVNYERLEPSKKRHR